MDGQTLVEVRDLKVHFPVRRGIFARTRDFIRAVDGVSFTVNRGETLGLVGESGSGKSTLARVLVSLVRPTSGTVTVAAKTAMVFQDPLASLNPRETVGEALNEVLKLSRPSAALTPGELLEKVGLDMTAMDKYPHEFSGGERQRICLARAVASGPEFLICDEAVSALDLSIRSEILELVADLKRKFALTVLFITHDLGVVAQVADRVAVMKSGRLVELGPVREVIENPRSEYTKNLIASIPKIW